MSALFLTIAEVAELTGRVQSASQCRHLKSVSIYYILDANGRPKITRESLSTPKTEPAIDITRSPNADALRRAMGGYK